MEMYLRPDHIVPLIHWREVRLREVKGLARKYIQSKGIKPALDLQLIAPVASFGLLKFTSLKTPRILQNLLLLSPPPAPQWCRASVFILRVYMVQEEGRLQELSGS